MELCLDIRCGGARIVGATVDVFDNPAMFAHALHRVSDYRRHKVEAYRFEHDKQLSLLAGLLLDVLLSERGLSERNAQYTFNEYGKPFLSECADVYFSLAHSGSMAVAGIASQPIGVDVEYLQQFPYDVADPHVWTSMESVGKALGKGIAEYVDACNVSDFAVPPEFKIEHILHDDHLVCIALQVE